METRRGAPDYDDSPWVYGYASQPPPLLHRRGVSQFLLATGAAAVAICAFLGATALLGGGSSARKPLSTLYVAGTSPIDTDRAATDPVAPPATTPAPRQTSEHKVAATERTHPARTHIVTPRHTQTVPPRAPGVRGRGVVIITGIAAFDGFTSAGTGMLMSSDGDIVTNNHVVRGSTSVRIKIPATGRTYRATVVGTDPSADVAVVHVRHATGLPVASLGNSSDVANAAIHNRVTALGNARGLGQLRTVHGRVTALRRSITARDENGKNPERLTGLIQTNAPVVAGDSGGPLYNSTNHIIGMNTAGSARASSSGVAVRSLAIPITRVLTIARAIRAGRASAQIHIGVPAITGVAVLDATRGGAYVKGVVRGGPAYRAGVTPGSVIIGVGRVRITSVKSLHAQLRRHRPGQRIALTWVDRYGYGHTAALTLAAGPAD